MELAANLSSDSPTIAGGQRYHKHAMTNGSRLFSVVGVDGRTMTARRFRDLVEEISNDLGGKSQLSETQRQLIRRASALSIMAESIESDLVLGRDFDLTNYGMVCDRLRRIVEALGLQRIPLPVNDGSTVLQDYFARPPAREAAE
jgi:hypothetical protein